MKAVYIKSYAHATRLGIKPFDTLISTVAIPSKKPKIVAFRGCAGFMDKDKGKYSMGKMVQYVSAGGERFFATSKLTLDILLKELFTRRPRMMKVSY
ncbi:unnamed protein product, partial [marine sediment metagenome]